MIRIETLTMAAAMLVFAGCRNDIEFDACGQIDAEQVTVSAEANGRILSLNVREGDVLEAGQMVGAVDSVQVRGLCSLRRHHQSRFHRSLLPYTAALLPDAVPLLKNIV